MCWRSWTLRQKYSIWAARGTREREGTHLVGVVVGRRDLDGGGQVEDDGPLLGLVAAGEPGLLDGVAQLDGKVGLGLREGLGRVLELPVGAVAARDGGVDLLAHNLDVLDGEVDRLLLRVAEDLVAEDGRGGVVHVEDDVLGVADALERALDELAARRREDLRGEGAEVSSRRRRARSSTARRRRTWSHTSSGVWFCSMRERIHWNSVSLALGKPASISLKPHLRRLRARVLGSAHGASAREDVEREDAQVKDALLLGERHGVDEGLVAVAQVGRGPPRGLGDALVGPCAVGEVDRGEGPAGRVQESVRARGEEGGCGEVIGRREDEKVTARAWAAGGRGGRRLWFELESWERSCQACEAEGGSVEQLRVLNPGVPRREGGRGAEGARGPGEGRVGHSQVLLGGILEPGCGRDGSRGSHGARDDGRRAEGGAGQHAARRVQRVGQLVCVTGWTGPSGSQKALCCGRG